MKLMMLAELGSTGSAEMSVFQRLFAGNGTNPFRQVSCPTVIPLHVPACPRAETENNDTTPIAATANIALRITAPLSASRTAWQDETTRPRLVVGSWRAPFSRSPHDWR